MSVTPFGPVGPTHPPLLDAALLVIAKVPVPGRVKTRLCPPLDHQQACDVAWACLLDTIDLAASVPSRRHVLVLDGAVGPWVPDRFEVIAQRGQGLAERLANAFAEIDDDAFLIAMDTPHAPAASLRDGLAAVSLGAPVLGLAEDGGFWAVGLPSVMSSDEVFLGVPMSVPDTGQVQLARLRSVSRSSSPGASEPVLLQVLRDIDTIDDLDHVAALAPRSRTAAVAMSFGVRAGSSKGLVGSRDRLLPPVSVIRTAGVSAAGRGPRRSAPPDRW